MDPTFLATLLILASALIHAVFNTFLKSHPDRLIFWAMMGGTGALLAAPFAFLVPLPKPDVWFWVVLSVGVHVAYQLLLATSYRYGDMSFAYPVARGMGPLLVAVIAPFAVGDALKSAEWIGILLICGGIASLAFTSQQDKNPHQNIRAALGFAILTGFSIAAYTTIDAIGIRAAENAFTFIIWLFILQGVVMGAGVALVRRQDFFQGLKADWQKGVGVSLLTLIGYTLALLAFRLGGLAEIAALRETSIVFAALLGAVFLKESLHRDKLIAIVIIAIGAVTVKII